MFIKQIDLISPRVTFYHKGYLAHSSILSGILSIISIVLIAVIAVSFSLEIIKRENPNSSYFISFIEDAPLYQMNSTSLFHFINIVQNSYTTIYEGIDFTTFRIIGFQRHYINYLNTNKNLKSMHHWLYGYCDNETDTEGINDLITYDFFGKTVCIKKYYNHNDNKYYDKTDPNFKWPKLDHGLFHQNNSVYNIVVERCQEETIKYVLGEGAHCRNNAQMVEYYKKTIGVRLFHLYFVDNSINVLNYTNPTNKFFYRIEATFSTETFSISNIFFNPTKIKTHNGIMMDNVIDDISYTFDRNEVYNEEKGKTDFFIVYCFFLRNMMHYYERTYKKIQDVFSSIGGMYQIIIIFMTIINSVYNEYIILLDTDILLNNSIYNEKNLFDEKKKKFKNSVKDIEKEENKKAKKFPEKKNIEKNIKEKSLNQNLNSNITNNNTKSKIFSVSEEINKKYHLNSNIFQEMNINNNEKLKRQNKQNNFFYFILYQITCGKKFTTFDVYKKFRKKIISEEHLIRNHLNVYNLLKYTEKKRTRRNSYQLKDLIKLI